jgi:hypothetical protein
MADTAGAHGERKECNAMAIAEEAGARHEDVVLDFYYKNLFTPVGGSGGTTASSWVPKAAPTFKAKPEDLDAEDSKVFLKSDPSRSVPFTRLGGNMTGSASSRPPSGTPALGENSTP